MTQVDKASSMSMNGINENGTNGNHSLSIEMHSTPNGSPMKDAYASSSAADGNDLQLSPASLNRRRSTRASALKAQEKIKYKEDVVVAETQDTEEPLEDEDESEENETVVKKRKLNDGRSMDQFCHRFGLRTNDDGDVYAMTDESENSSLHESEMEVIRVHYDKMMSRELTAEQAHERLMMRKEAEAKLRLEEARLALLRKMKHSQTVATQKMAEAKKLTGNLTSINTAVGGAYKPIVAPPLNKTTPTTTAAPAATNGKQQTSATAASSTQPSRNAALLALAGMTPQQQQELMARLSQNPQAAAQALMTSKNSGQNSQAQQIMTQLLLNMAQQQQQAAAKETPKEPLPPAATPSNPIAVAQAKLMASQTPQQRNAAARMAFRAQADKQLMQAVNAPKAPPPDFFFIPNANTSDFAVLLGLDIVVQRVLKDKAVHKKVTEPCYECEECHTDFTPAWKAIGSSSDDLHLYCEACVRNAQKRKIRVDQTNFLKKAYQKISMQEKEFEKKISEGTLENMMSETVRNTSTPTATASTSAPIRNNNTSSGASTPTVPKSVTPMPPSTPKPSSTQNNTPSGKKAPTPAAAIQQQQQQHLLMMQQLMHNPMTANLLRNPMMAQQMMSMWNAPALAAMSAQARLPHQNTNGMAALMAMMAQAAQQQSGGGSSSNSNNASQMAALASLMGNPQMAGAMMNPQLARTLQQLSASDQRRVFEQMRKSK